MASDMTSEKSPLDLVDKPDKLVGEVQHLLRQIRVTAGWVSPSELAEFAGVSDDVVCALESGSSCSKLDCGPEDLLSVLWALGIGLDRAIPLRKLAALSPEERGYWVKRMTASGIHRLAGGVYSSGSAEATEDTATTDAALGLFVRLEVLRCVCEQPASSRAGVSAH